MAIDFESFDTWPHWVVEVLKRHEDLLIAYELRERDHSQVRKSAPFPHLLFLENDYAAKRNRVLEVLCENLQQESLIGYHCTRLLPHEAQDIKESGLKPLSPQLVTSRIEGGLACGDLESDIAEKLLAVNEVLSPYRRDIWFVNLRSILCDEGDVIRFFRSWGGEVIYNSHEGQLDTGPAIRRIGTPYIVIAEISVPRLKLCCNLGEKFANAFLQNLGVETQNGADFESHVCEPVQGELIPFSDPQFELLTSCSKWRERIA